MSVLQAQQDPTGQASALKCKRYEILPRFLVQLSLILELLLPRSKKAIHRAQYATGTAARARLLCRLSCRLLCRAMAEGLKVYTRGLPARYTQTAHLASLQRALRAFRALARGPHVTSSAAQLRQVSTQADSGTER